MGSLSIAPVLAPVFSQMNFAGLTVDQVSFIVVRPPADTLLRQAFTFAPESTQLAASLAIPLQHQEETLDVYVELLAGGQVMFNGLQQVVVVAGQTGEGQPPTQIPLVFVGPGNQIAAISISPKTPTLGFGANLQFQVTAIDSQSQPVSQFYVGWLSTDPAHLVNANGLLRTGVQRGTFSVVARTPTGITDTARVFVSPAASQLQIVSGDNQSATSGLPLAQPLVVRAIALDNLPVAGLQVQFSAQSGGGSVTTQTVATDTLGLASTTVTLGNSFGGQSFRAAASGVTPVTFAATALHAAGVPTTITKLPAGDNQTVGAGLPVPVAPTVRVTDDFATPVANIAVTFAVTSGGGAVVGGSTTTDSAGLASVGSWTLGATPGGNTLAASLPAFPTAPAATFSATGAAGPAITLSIAGGLVAVGQPSVLQVHLTVPAPAGGLTVTLASDSAQYATVAAPGSVTFAQGEVLQSIVVNGVAPGVTMLRGTAPGYTAGALLVGVTPKVLTVSAATVAAGQTGSVTIQAIPVPAANLAVTVTSTDTTILKVTTPSVTILAGQPSTTATVQGVGIGAAGVLATAPGYAAGGNAVTVTSATGAVSTVVTPHLDTLTAIAGTFTLVAQGRDTANNPVAGTFTWVSRAPAVATVNPSGVVTAVTNGSTYVVATEAGGSRDSALIVVEQRLASINVSPAVRSIYLTRDYTFSAVAVDGGGTPLPSQPVFTWSTTAPAVATVDAAGKVTGVGLGVAQIRATSGAVIGVANVSIITPITRIAVVVDTAGAAVTDTFSMPSLGLTRRYRAIAHDTLDAVMSGVAFTWVSTNGSVAVMNTVAGDTASATSAANGVTEIRATAQGFTSSPGARLLVSQVLASIDLAAPASNPTATIAASGTVGLVARGKDANNRYIAGGSFTFASAAPLVATVDPVTGVVTGVANGSAGITATSGAITSNVLTVTVAIAGVPAIISFGRDTVSVGRGSTASIPILLSKPNGTDLTVNLSATAFAHWQTASVTITAGQTAVNATLVGDSAGTTTVTATDGSGAGYSTGTAVAKVTANMRLTNSGYSILTNDIVATQVLLSDPSPAGGTYVTFNYGTPGIAAISPDPAFIPAGQLAADIQIRALAAGSSQITPSAVGVNGTSSNFTAYPPVLYPNTTFIRLGQGQYDPNEYVYTQVNTNIPIPVTLTSSDTVVARASPPAVTIPGGTNYVYFNVSGPATGTATITPTSSGWTAANAMTVVVTTPYVGVCCGAGYLTTSPQFNVTVYAEDSLRSAHYRNNSLVVQLRSTDTTVIRLVDTLVTINPGSYYTTARAVPGGLGGTAWVVATASGHVADSTQYTVTGPSLYFSWGTNRIGAGQEDYNLYVYAQNNVTAPLKVALVNPDTAVLGVPDTVTIPAGSNYVYFTVRGRAPGSVTLTATALGYQNAGATYVVTSPRVVISGGSTINNFAPARGYVVYATDSLGNAHYRTLPLTVTLASRDTMVVATDTIATIGAGQYYTVTQPQLTIVGVGATRVVAAAAGHGADSTTYTVVTPKLNLSWTSYIIGRRQHRSPTDFYVYTPDNRPVPVPVTLAQANAAVESLTTLSPDIPAGLNYRYFTFYGLANGVDTVIASATGYLPDTAFVTVTSPRLIASGLPGSTTTTNPPIGVTVYVTDSLGNAHYASDTLVVAAVSSDTTVIRPTQPYFVILKDAYYASPTVTVVGPGSASMTYSDSAGSGYAPTTTNAMTVTGPSLFLSNGSPVLGMRQRGGTNSSYVYTQNNVASPLTVNLASTDTRVTTVPASVTIPAGQNYAYFEVTALDTLGTIQIQATATGYGGTAMTVQVTQPRFVVSTSNQANTTSAPQGITVYATDANGNAHYTTEDVTVTLLSTAPSVAAVDSTTVTILNGNYLNNLARWSPGLIGTAQIQASDGRAVQYAYNPGAAGVTVITPSLNFSSMPGILGIGQYVDNAYVYTPDLAAAPLSVSFAHTGAARITTMDNGTTNVNSGVTIAAAQNYTYFRVVGSAAGTDTMTASVTTPVHNPATVYTVVGQGRSDPIGGWPSTLTFGDSVQVTLYARDPNGNGRNVLAATDFTPTLANLEFWSGGASSVMLTTVTVPADAYYVQFYVKATGHGTGSGTIAATNYQTQTLPTVTIP